MRSALIEDLDLTYWANGCYQASVRGETFLWGSNGITVDASFPRPVTLHLRNSRHGEPITLSLAKAGGVRIAIGALERGQILSVSLDGLAGVVADCAAQSDVWCLIK